MATIAAVKTYVKNGLSVDWGTLDVGDDGEWVEVYDWPTIVVQPTGNGDILWEGTNDLAVPGVAANFNSGTYPLGYPSTIPQRFRYIRPRHDGTGTTAKPRLFASRQI